MPQQTYHFHEARHLGGKFDFRYRPAIDQATQREARGVAVIQSGFYGRGALHPQFRQPFCLVKTIYSTRIAKMLQRMRDDPLKESAIFGNFGFHHFSVVKRPLMPM